MEADATLKTMAFALFIYSLGFVLPGPKFFGSLGRSTLNQLHLAFFPQRRGFRDGLDARVAGLDQGTAAGLLANASDRVGVGRDRRQGAGT